MVFQFEHVQLDQGANKWDLRPLDLLRLKASLGRWQAGAGRGRLEQPVLEQPRPAARGVPVRLRRPRAPGGRGQAAGHRAAPAPRHALRLPGRGAGHDERAVHRVTDFRDIESINYHAAAVASGRAPDEVLAALRTMSRDNARTPVQWDAARNAGFTTGTPWLPVNPNYRRSTRPAQWADPDSVLQHYRAVIALRHAEPAVVHGDFTMLLPDDPVIYAFTREFGTMELLVLANFSRRPGRRDLGGRAPALGQGRAGAGQRPRPAHRPRVGTAARVGGANAPPGDPDRGTAPGLPSAPSTVPRSGPAGRRPPQLGPGRATAGPPQQSVTGHPARATVQRARIPADILTLCG